MNSSLSERHIQRDDLVRIIDAASEGCKNSTRAKLRAVAETTDAVTVGWFHCSGVGCPSRQARRHNQVFQAAFDRAMCERFEIVFAEDHISLPFVVRVDG
jgi:hypothetical protein